VPVRDHPARRLYFETGCRAASLAIASHQRTAFSITTRVPRWTTTNHLVAATSQRAARRRGAEPTTGAAARKSGLAARAPAAPPAELTRAHSHHMAACLFPRRRAGSGCCREQDPVAVGPRWIAGETLFPPRQVGRPARGSPDCSR
jgi:hypothetical protein